MILRTLLFLIINFAALGVGSFFTGSGVSSDWYAALNKAPWTPPGWVFGMAWGTIMVCFALFMARAWTLVGSKRQLIILFTIQWVLNVAWNPAFFYFHQVLFSLLIITALTLLMGYFLFGYLKTTRWAVLAVLPYVIWLMIATSLNVYIYMYN